MMLKAAKIFCGLSVFVAALFQASLAEAKLKVVATTADVGALVREVAADDVTLDVIAKGTQDPHSIEPKPSFMVKLSKADLLISNGLSLEVGWLPSLVQGARNPKVRADGGGFLDLGETAEPLEIPTGQITRAMGDVHPEGNPHFTLDPIRNGKLANAIAEKLGSLDSPNEAKYAERAKAFQTRMETMTKTWQERIAKSGVKKLITYHPSLNYFLKRFNLEAAAFLEPKPGIPPTAQHILSVIETAKREKISLVLVDNFFDSKIADRVVKEVSGARVQSVGISVGSAPGLEKLEDVTEQLVRAIEGKK